MRALVRGRWIDGLADYHRGARDYRIDVVALANLEKLGGLYFTPGLDPRRVLNYLREIGVRDSLRKVWSRLGERHRNDKYLSCGVGRIGEAPEGGSLRPGQLAVFLLPSGPACVERVVLPEPLLRPVPAFEPARAAAGDLLHLGVDAHDEPPWWKPLRAWHPESGHAIDASAALALKECERFLGTADWGSARRLPGAPTPVRCEVGAPAPSSRSRAPRTILFGYGNYAKTVILPSIESKLDVVSIHEIDPTQIPLRGRGDRRWTTSPLFESDERADAVVIAGYHHTHAPLACEAMRRGAAVVVEKPVATSRDQLRKLLSTLDETGGRIFAGFQRRYLEFNEMALEDLRVAPGQPISYFCIAYAVPLPGHHWYRWPRSGSCLASNGCHWIDHFLYLNDYAEIEDCEATMAGDGTVQCWATLANGASFSMVLTKQGSSRLGMRERVELRSNGATVTIDDSSRYQSEDGSRIVRRARRSRQDAYRRMYRAVCQRIAGGDAGDSKRSIQQSVDLVLRMEERLRHRHVAVDR